MTACGCKPGQGALYNNMVAPYAKMRMTAVLWYQGEANVGTKKAAFCEGWGQMSYACLFPKMILARPNPGNSSDLTRLRPVTRQNSPQPVVCGATRKQRGGSNAPRKRLEEPQRQLHSRGPHTHATLTHTLAFPPRLRLSARVRPQEWRKLFADPSLFFAYVQIAPYTTFIPDSESNFTALAELRFAQARTADTDRYVLNGHRWVYACVCLFLRCGSVFVSYSCVVCMRLCTRSKARAVVGP